MKQDTIVCTRLDRDGEIKLKKLMQHYGLTRAEVLRRLIDRTPLPKDTK